MCFSVADCEMCSWIEQMVIKSNSGSGGIEMSWRNFRLRSSHPFDTFLHFTNCSWFQLKRATWGKEPEKAKVQPRLRKWVVRIRMNESWIGKGALMIIIKMIMIIPRWLLQSELAEPWKTQKGSQRSHPFAYEEQIMWKYIEFKSTSSM